MFDEELPRRPKTHEVGMPLDTLSIEELESRIALLNAEVDRLRAAIRSKAASRDAAETFFRK